MFKRTKIISLALCCALFSGFAQAAVIHDESIDGELPNIYPYTDFGTLGLGSHSIIGTLPHEYGRSGNTYYTIYNGDRFKFDLAAEHRLEGIYLRSWSANGPIDASLNMRYQSGPVTRSAYWFNMKERVDTDVLGLIGFHQYFTDEFAKDFLFQMRSENGSIFNNFKGIANYELELVVGQVSAVPLPAALPLYGAGLAVLGFVGWRKKRKAAA